MRDGDLSAAVYGGDRVATRKATPAYGCPHIKSHSEVRVRTGYRRLEEEPPTAPAHLYRRCGDRELCGGESRACGVLCPFQQPECRNATLRLHESQLRAVGGKCHRSADCAAVRVVREIPGGDGSRRAAGIQIVIGDNASLSGRAGQAGIEDRKVIGATRGGHIEPEFPWILAGAHSRARTHGLRPVPLQLVTLASGGGF